MEKTATGKTVTPLIYYLSYQKKMIREKVSLPLLSRYKTLTVKTN